MFKDPALRLREEKWHDLIKPSKNNVKDCAFIYILYKKEKYEQICCDLKCNNKICLFNSNSGDEEYEYSPLEFASLVSNLSEVITNSFHGACFATIFIKPLTIYKHNEFSDIRYDIFKNYNNLKNII